jgi:predicted transcriptional regulator YdeE
MIPFHLSPFEKPSSKGDGCIIINMAMMDGTMQPQITEAKQITLMGLSFYGDPFDTHAGWDEDNQIGKLWKRFMAFLSQHGEAYRNFHNPNVTYEVHISSEETCEKGLFEVFVGMEIKDITSVPVELLVKILPATQYAIFTIKGEQIRTDWEMMLEGWLSTSGYRCPYSYNFQLYDERFKGLDNLAESTLDVYLPIQKVV